MGPILLIIEQTVLQTQLNKKQPTTKPTDSFAYSSSGHLSASEVLGSYLRAGDLEGELL